MADITQKLADFIESREGFRADPYQDQHGTWTIGYGHTKGVTADSPSITREQGLQYLQEDAQNALDSIQKLVTTDLNDNQKAALISLVFNEGTAPLTHHLGIYLNDGDYDAAANQFDAWVYITLPDGTKEKSDGLIARRAAEKALFNEPVGTEVADNENP